RSRMTCDVDLAFSDDSRRLTGPGGMVLVESKTVGAAGQVDAILWRLGHRPVALSKYCAGQVLRRAGAAGSAAAGEPVEPHPPAYLRLAARWQDCRMGQSRPQLIGMLGGIDRKSVV